MSCYKSKYIIQISVQHNNDEVHLCNVLSIQWGACVCGLEKQHDISGWLSWTCGSLSWKDDLCRSLYKLMFKSTNAHLQLLLFSPHLFFSFSLTHTHKLISSEVFLQGSWTGKREVFHSSFHQLPVKFRPWFAGGSNGWWCVVFKEHKRIDATIRSLIKVLLEAVQSLISYSPTYQLPHHQLNTMWETIKSFPFNLTNRYCNHGNLFNICSW